MGANGRPRWRSKLEGGHGFERSISAGAPPDPALLRDALMSGTPSEVAALAKAGADPSVCWFAESGNGHVVKLSALAKCFGRFHESLGPSSAEGEPEQWIEAARALLGAGAKPSDPVLTSRQAGPEQWAGAPVQWDVSWEASEAPSWEWMFRAFAGIVLSPSVADLAREAVAMMLAAGWEAGQAGLLGRSGLHWSASMGLEGACVLLAGAGAPADAEDNFGRTPIGCARDAGRDRLAELLAAMSERAQLAGAASPANADAQPTPPRRL